MRIFGLEITRAPKKSMTSKLWNRSNYYENGRQINDMTPIELRRELSWVRARIDEGGGKATLVISPSDIYQRIRAPYN